MRESFKSEESRAEIVSGWPSDDPEDVDNRQTLLMSSVFDPRNCQDQLTRRSKLASKTAEMSLFETNCRGNLRY